MVKKESNFGTPGIANFNFVVFDVTQSSNEANLSLDSDLTVRAALFRKQGGVSKQEQELKNTVDSDELTSTSRIWHKLD